MNNELNNRYLNAKRALIDKYLSKGLNERQCEAVRTVNGPLLIIAGAGSGKTTVLVQRIAFIIKYGDAYYSDFVPDFVDDNYVNDMETAVRVVAAEDLGDFLVNFASDPCPPYSMLAITFTNKAANEIKERLASAISDSYSSHDIWAGTFHSICVRILRKNCEVIGYQKDFSIYDTDDKKHLISDVMKSLNIDEKFLSPKLVANEISSAKDRLIKPEDYVSDNNLKGKHILKIYTEYQKRLKACNAMDFDDIIAETVYMFQEHPDIAEYYQNKFRYVCVDEYQDTNYAQFMLTEIISRKRRNVMVVGDDDQSIYKFRGATIENILNFDKTYCDATVIKLEQNYRSTKNILAAANAVISNNNNRHGKSLWCAGEPGEKITIHEASDQNDESKYISNTISSLVAQGKYDFKDFAVLYRVNEIARSLESAFAKSGMPYRVLGGQRFYDKKEVRDIIAYLHVILNDRDEQKLKRIINEPKRKIGAATIDAVCALANEEHTTMMQIMRNSKNIMLLSKIADKLTAFSDMIDTLRQESHSVSELIEEVFVRSGYRQMLIDGGEVEKPRIQAVEELMSAAQEYENRAETPSLSGFLEEVALVSDVDKYDEDSNAVVLMTVHSAKGLEFPVVFLAAMEENIFPSSQNVFYEDELSEERRLAYVAITRAKQKLYITHAGVRLLYGRTSANPLSRFVGKEIPGNLIEKDGRIIKSPFGSEYFGARTTVTQRADEVLSKEFLRKVQTSDKPKAPSQFGIERMSEGTRVHHATFGDGKILSVRELGGDILYEVAFDSGTTKKLMATYAKLQKSK